jgi:ADP-dependent glucokinase
MNIVRPIAAGALLALLYMLLSAPEEGRVHIWQNERSVDDVIYGIDMRAQMLTVNSNSKLDLSSDENDNVWVCCNTNIDMIVNGVDAIEAILSNVPGASDSLHVRLAETEVLANVSHFIGAFYDAMRSGSAAERFMESANAMNDILDALNDDDADGGARFATGGNAALMANRLAAIGARASLFGPIGSRLAATLNGGVRVAIDQDRDQDQDQVHLIMEYARGAHAVIGGGGERIVAPRANRFIASHDVSNMRLYGVDEMLRRIEASDGSDLPPLLVISGSHIIEGLVRRDVAAHDERVRTLRAAIDAARQRHAVAHLELASIGEARTMDAVTRLVVPHADSIGLNEQELGALYAAVGGEVHAPDAFKAPSAGVAIEAIEHVLDWVGADRPLSRVHMHFLSYHVICVSDAAKWPRASTVRAVAAGSRATTTQACGPQPDRWPDASALELQHIPALVDISDELDPLDMSLSRQSGGFVCSVSPVVVCQQPTRVVGLGDTISSTAIYVQLDLDRK